ncbi:MAG: histidine kinase [Sphaerochaetaceae bacterium]|nr:histidine kinase [Sphaerochaetaceae bacterium]
MKKYNQLNLKGKMLVILIPVVLISFILTSYFWYNTASKNADEYLNNITKAYISDAQSNFDYILTDNFHMITLISLNTKSIIDPVKEINKIPSDTKVLNLNYITNHRKVKDFITTMNGYKYYIVGISIASLSGYVYQTSSILKNSNEIMDLCKNLDQDKLKSSMIMLSPMQVEGTWIKLQSDYVIPAVRGILNTETQEIIGYTILYFDYSLLETMFTNNLPEGSLFQVTDRSSNIIFSNTNTNFIVTNKMDNDYRYSQLKLKDVDWTLNIAIPTSIVMKNIYTTLLNTFLFMIPILIILSIILVIIISSFSNRIKVISDTMKKVSKAKHLLKIEESKNQDELETIIHSYNEMIDEIHLLMVQIQKDEKQKAEQRIKLLQAQIDPHFVANTLNTISWMARKQNAGNIVGLTDSMNTLLRAHLKIESQFVKLEDEIESVKSYVNIMLLSGNHDFSVKYDIQEETKNISILKFIIQPLVENSILHGFCDDDLLKENKLTIKVYIDRAVLYIEILDNGKGMNKIQCKRILNTENDKSINNKNGIGCLNVRERIKLVYKDKGDLFIESSERRYTKVTIALNLRK